jgi:TonB family protein
MGYQALLFCPDEKTARTVTQVLSELDFTVTPCTEPFAAVKKLMGEHFDAVVVDCDNEQNATLLFKSARNTTNNQSSLAVAVVEGQAGVAKAFRIGANLVLTKPINLEQAKGTVRVARGLLRKNEGSKPASTSATATAKPTPPVPPPAKAAPQTKISRVDSQQLTEPIAPITTAAAASAPAQQSASLAFIAASIPDEIVKGIAVSESAREEIASPEITKHSDGSAPKIISAAPVTATGAASAPAPAREARSIVSNEGRSPLFVDAGSPAGPVTDFREKTHSSDTTSLPAPSFTFGGAVGSGAESGSGGGKKLFIAMAAVALIAAGSYAAWMHWGHSGDSQTTSSHAGGQLPKTSDAAPVAVPQTKPRSGAITTSSPSSAQPSSAQSTSTQSTRDSSATSQQSEVAKPSSDAPSTGTGKGKASAHPGKDKSDTDLSKPSASTVASNKAPAMAEDVQPIVIKNQPSKPATKPSVANDAPALSITNIAPVGGAAPLPQLMGPSTTTTPVLQRLNISQGVSRGLLVKQVQPSYPSSALRMHIEGSVQLLATLSKNGDITGVKILHGDSQLAQAAVTAVRQWKYKPYLLNGEPVEIQTEITVNFKLPR